MSRNDRAIFQGYVYEARNENCSMAVYWFALDGSRSGRTPLDGCAKGHIAIAASHNDDFLVVAARGQDDGLWTRTTFNGDTYTGWTNGGDSGRMADEPVAHTVSSAGYVGVMVTVSGGPNTYTRYSKFTGDGTTWSGWFNNRGREIQAGTNLLSNNADNGGRLDAALNTLAPEVVRVRMFCCGDSFTLRHRAADLDNYVSKGVRTMILTTEDAAIDFTAFERQIRYTDIGGGSILDWARRQRYVNVFIELGNEPDQTARWGSDPYGARSTALETIRLYNERIRAGNQNVRVLVSLPTRNDGGLYFDQFTRDAGDGRGLVGNAFDGVAVHQYAGENGCLFWPGQNNRANITLAEQRSNGVVYVTEGNINTSTGLSATHNLADPYERKWAEVGRRMVQGVSWLDDSYGRVRGFTFFQTDYTNFRFGGGDGEVEHYNVDTRPVNQPLPLHGHWAVGNRALDGQCPIK